MLNNRHVATLFIVLLFLRFFTEYIDAYFGLKLSVSLTFVISLFGILLFSVRLDIDRAHKYIIGAWVIFILSAFLSTVISNTVDLKQSIIQIYRYIMFVSVFYYSKYIFRDKVLMKRFFIFVLVAILISSLMVIFQAVTNTSIIKVHQSMTSRGFGFSSHPVLFGIEIILCFALLITTSKNLGRHYEKAIWCVSPILLLGLYYTYARTAWVMFAFVLIMCSLSKKKLSNKYFSILILTACFLVGIPLFLGYFQDLLSIFYFVENRLYEKDNAYLYFDSSMHWRVYQWFNLIDTGLEKWFLGWGTSQSIYLNEYKLSAHSFLVDVFVDQGLIGVMALFLWLYACHKYIKKYSIKSWFIYAKYTLYSCLLAAFFSVSIFYETFNMILIWILLASFSSLSEYERMLIKNKV
jgi:O-antigen ligase/polysaccharide polymerase Wzy-like membrane protein